MSDSLRNHGLGPAIVKDRYLSKDGERFQPQPATRFEVAAFIQSVIGEKFKYRLQRHGLPGIGAAVPSQCEHVIAELSFPDLSPGQVTSIEDALPELHFHVEYERCTRKGIRSVPLATPGGNEKEHR